MVKAAPPKHASVAPADEGGRRARVSGVELEAALGAMPRTEERTKERMRSYFVEGRSIPDVAALHGVGVESVANAVRRVRAQLAILANPETPTHRNSRSKTQIVRLRPETLERALAGMPRTEEQTKERMRGYFVEGMSAPEVAALYGVGVESIANAVRRVREAVEVTADPWQYVEATVALPLALIQELQAFADEMATLPHRADADRALKSVHSAIVKARKLTQTTQ